MDLKRWLIIIAIFSFCSSFSQSKEQDSLLIQLAFQKSDSIKVNTSIKLIKLFSAEKDYFKAKQYITETDKLATEINYKEGIAELSYLKAQIFSKEDNHTSAIENYNKSLAIYSQLQDSLGIAKVNNSLGLIQIKRGDYSKGLRFSLSAIEIFEKKGLKQELGIAYNNLAEAYFNTNVLDKALKYNLLALDIRKALNNPEEIIETNIAIANLYSLQNEHRTSIEYYETAINFLNINEDMELLGSILPEIAKEHLYFKEYNKALIYLDDGLSINRDIDNKKGLLKTLIYYADLNVQINKTKLGEYQITEAQKLAIEVEDDKLQLETLNVLIKLESAKGNFKEAFSWQQQYYTLKERIDASKEKTILIENPEPITVTTPVIEDSSKLNEALSTNQTLDLELKKFKLLFYSLLAAIFVLSIVIYFLGVSNRRKNKKLQEHPEETIQVSSSEVDTLKSQVSQLEDMNRVKNRLFSIVSHDLKDSITSIKSFLDLVKEQNISKDEFEKLLPALSDNADNASSLLLNLLNWSKSQMKNLDPKAVYFNIQDVFKEKLNLVEKKAKDKQIILLNESDSALVYADQSMIEIVIQNLLANAIKFSDTGDVIKVSNRDKNGNVLVCVEDTGVGISKENQEKLFKTEGFTTRGTDQEKGTGLGLSICKQLVELNKGHIWVESEPNLGSKFFVELPRAQAL